MSADKVAVRLRVRRSTALEALRRHPLIVHNGRPRRASRYRLIVNAGSDFQPWGDWQRAPERMVVEPEERHRPVVCPSCGVHRTEPAYVWRKVQRGLRSGRCGRCAEQWAERRTALVMADREREELTRWWLASYSDEELAAVARALGMDASPATFAAARDALTEPSR